MSHVASHECSKGELILSHFVCLLPLQGVAGQEGDAERGQQHQLPPPDGAVRLARLRQPAHAHLLPQPAEGRDRIRPLRQAERHPGQSATEKISDQS